MQPSVVSCVARRLHCQPALLKPGINHVDTRNSFSSIDTMTIFRKISVDSSLDAPDKHEVLVAIITSQNLSTANTGHGLQDKRVLNSDGATLLYDLSQHGDCRAEFMCEVQGVNNQGERLVSTITLQPQTEQRENHKTGGSLMPVMFVQLFSELHSKLDSFENRIEDKLNNQIMDKLYQLDLKVSTNNIDGSHSKAGPARNTSDSLEVLVKELHMDHQHMFEEFSHNMSNLLASVESGQSLDLITSCPHLNLTEATSREILTNRLFNETLSSQKELLHIVRQLESTISNSTVEALSSMRDCSSVASQGITGDQVSDINSAFELKYCKNAVQPQNASYPYPVVTSNSQSGLSVEYMCDTVTDGGGWIVIQRRSTGNTIFANGWDDYKEGFGRLYDDFWLGNENIHTLTSEGNWELRIDLRSKSDAGFAIYKDFSVEDENDKYRLRLGCHSGTLRDSLRDHDKMQFSTYDSDNDEDSRRNCAASDLGRAGWWYESCGYADLNGVWRVSYDYGVEWDGFTGKDVINFTEMKIRRVD